jgi:hypothetical protein
MIPDLQPKKKKNYINIINHQDKVPTAILPSYPERLDKKTKGGREEAPVNHPSRCRASPRSTRKGINNAEEEKTAAAKKATKEGVCVRLKMAESGKDALAIEKNTKEETCVCKPKITERDRRYLQPNSDKTG